MAHVRIQCHERCCGDSTGFRSACSGLSRSTPLRGVWRALMASVRSLSSEGKVGVGRRNPSTGINTRTRLNVRSRHCPMIAKTFVIAKVCHERREGLDVGESFLKRCCARDEGRPFGVALRGEASNRPLLHWLETVVVSDVGKGALDVSGRDQEGERKRIAADVSSIIRVTSKPGCLRNPGISLAGARLLARRCPAWKRREPDQAAFAWNVRRRAPILPSCFSGGERECPKRLKPQGIEYRCGVRWRTGP